MVEDPRLTGLRNDAVNALRVALLERPHGKGWALQTVCALEELFRFIAGDSETREKESPPTKELEGASKNVIAAIGVLEFTRDSYAQGTPGWCQWDNQARAIRDLLDQRNRWRAVEERAVEQRRPQVTQEALAAGVKATRELGVEARRRVELAHAVLTAALPHMTPSSGGTDG